ncbi:MAG: class C beta-lactamase-related serine hydrolase [Cryomorphaceae bacterium]|nr:MAG: class C beta-lactamase-related serine hydrolase [Cryomorphaceae bacterium]
MIRRLFLGFLLLIILIASGLYFTGNGHVLVAVSKTYFVGQKGPSIDDFRLFDHRRIEAPGGPSLPNHAAFNRPLSADDISYLESYGTAAYLVVHRDSVLTEHFFDEYSAQSYLNTFSMAKSFVSMAVGVLLREGMIKSLDEPASNYVPELAERNEHDVTIRHLLQMASGYGFDENYKNPLGYQARVYYGNQLREHTLAFGPEKPAGSEFYYAGGNTILLAMIVEAASGESLANFFSRHIWKAIGAEADAWWTTDKPHGMERSSCCFYAQVRDLARLGLLYMHGGEWKGKTVIPPDYVEASVSPIRIPDRYGETVMHYGFQWWLGNHNGTPFFQAQGMLGQYIIVVPDYELVVVRLGHQRSDEKLNHLPADAYQYINIAQQLMP